MTKPPVRRRVALLPAAGHSPAPPTAAIAATLRTDARRVRAAGFALRAAVAALALGAVAPRQASAIPIDTFALQDCAEAQLKTAASLHKKRTGALLKCASALLECRLADELGAGDFATCSADVTASCEASLDKVAAGEEKARAKLAKGCEPLADHDFGSTAGLGLRRLREECGPVTTEAEAQDCVLSRVRCRAADSLESVFPRAFELFDAAGLVASRPDDVACLDTVAAAPAASGDAEALADCQAGLAKALTKVFYKTPRELGPCVGDLLECRLRGDRRVTNRPAPPACYSEDAPVKSCDKAESKLAAALGSGVVDDGVEACAAVAAPDLLASLNFAAPCPSAVTVADAVECARDRLAAATLEFVDDAAPRTCQLSRESGDGVFALSTHFCAPECGNNEVEDGETCDDGNGDPYDSCTNSCETGPTVATAVSLPAYATPAHTPDGTAPNAVAPGSSVAVQFGTTTPDLNNVSYVRYASPGAGDPDAVLVLVPGFSGGAHSLKIVAETMVKKAAEEGTKVLEVWAFERRTDQLEDDAGGQLAESEDDPRLALDWYFGAELGLSLDPRLSRRAVFHQPSDIPFTANFTYNMFIHDIDRVVDAALALPGPPTVFLGGHSLGTLFSARYAATDLDPGPALVPGHSKVAGLVLFEGGGDSMPVGPPSADALDTVISKVDGGLYHAIQDQAPRCWTGTPCVTNADCAAQPLATGALTNKCIEPTASFPADVVTPQIHAVGDAASIQARRTPDSLSIAQVDFGAGAAVDVVPGLSLLGLLPNGSAESAVGFFLDDDYSPEVSFMTSMGISDNGINTDVGSFYLAGPATNDPYRLWKGIDAAMPPAALRDNGPVTGAFDVNGVEKEMTPMASVLTMLRTADRNIGDWYFPLAGLGATVDLIVGVGGFTGGLDSTALSVGRGRPDIENLTEGPNIDIPIICFGGSNGISPTPGAFLPFAESIATCTAPSCDGTPRIVASDPETPTYGDAAGGFEAYVSPGYAHLDIVAAEDDDTHNLVYTPLLAFLERNTP